jgi:hypothetical protein
MIQFYRHPVPIKKEVEISYINKDDNRIIIAPFFIYELTTSKYIIDNKQHRYEVLNSKMVKSNKEIRSKFIIQYIPNKKKMEYCIMKDLIMIGAPIEYITNNNFPVWELNKKKYEKRKSSISGRKVHKLRR